MLHKLYFIITNLPKYRFQGDEKGDCFKIYITILIGCTQEESHP